MTNHLQHTVLGGSLDLEKVVLVTKPGLDGFLSLGRRRLDNECFDWRGVAAPLDSDKDSPRLRNTFHFQASHRKSVPFVPFELLSQAEGPRKSQAFTMSGTALEVFDFD